MNEAPEYENLEYFVNGTWNLVAEVREKRKKKDSRFSFVLSLTRSARSVASVPLSIDEDTRASASPPIVVVLVVAVAAP